MDKKAETIVKNTDSTDLSKVEHEKSMEEIKKSNTESEKIYQPFIGGLSIFFAVIIALMCALANLAYSQGDTPALAYILMAHTALFFLFASIYESKMQKKSFLSYAYGALFLLEAAMVVTHNLVVYYLVTIFGSLLGIVVVIMAILSQSKANPFAKKNKVVGKSIVIVLLIITMVAGIASNVLLYRAGYHEEFAFYHGKIYKDVRYGEDPIRNSMDLYIPADYLKNEKRYAVIVIHGGSWVSGHKERISGEAKKIAKEGHLAVTINYTFLKTKENKIEETLNDITNALKQLKAMSNEYGWNISKIALTGYSAGGHLSLLYAYTMAEASPFEIAFVASKVGPAVLSYDHWSEKQMDNFARFCLGEDPEIMYAKYKQNSQQSELSYKDFVSNIVKHISPHKVAHPNAPPTLFTFATKDKLVSINEGQDFKQALEDYDVEHSYVIFEKSSHFLVEDRKQLDKYYAEFARFAKTYFK